MSLKKTHEKERLSSWLRCFTLVGIRGFQAHSEMPDLPLLLISIWNLSIFISST